jgi:hypothetical protein
MNEMAVAAQLAPWEVEVGDYITFSLGENTHEGVVLDIEDKEDVFVLTLVDDDEGDKVECEIPSNADISLLTYVEMAV